MNPHPQDIADARALADLVLLNTGLYDDAQPDPVVVAERLGIPMMEVPPSRLSGARGLTSWVSGGYVIEIDETMSEPNRQAVAGHELGHACCRLWNVTPREWERFAWLFSGALLVRRDFVADLWRRSRDLRALVEALPHVPPTSVALAVGEHGIANVVVTQWRDVRYTRGRGSLPPDVEAIGLAAAKSGQHRRGLARAWRLDDMPGRAAVVSDAA